VKTVKRLRASSRKISVLRTENSAVNTRTICLCKRSLCKG